MIPKDIPTDKHPPQTSHHTHHPSHDHDLLSHHRHMADDFRKRFFLALPLTLIILLLSPPVQNLLNFSFTLPQLDLVLVILGSVVAFWGGFPFFLAAKDEIKSNNWGMMTLVSLAIGAGYLFSLSSTFFFAGETLWWEIATLITVFLFGHWLEMRAVLGTGGALNELAKLIPPTALRLAHPTGQPQTVATQSLRINDLVLVRPGQKIPIDGVVVRGRSAVNEALLTGESRPVTKKPGNRVIGGSLNYDGSLVVRVDKTGQATALGQIMQLVRQAQTTRPKVQDLADRAARLLTFTAIFVGTGTFIYWYFLHPAGVIFAATLAITVIVIACPHALGLAIPTVTTITASLAAKNGLLIKDMKGLEAAKNLDYLVFDKTGTLTTGEYRLARIVPRTGYSQKTLLRLAAAVEYHSRHPLAQSIVREANRQKISFRPAGNFLSFPGLGAEGTVGRTKIILGNQKMFSQRDFKIADIQLKPRPGPGQTVIRLAKNREIIGAFYLEDKLRHEAAQALAEIRRLGVKTVMLTGDRREPAAEIARKLNITSVFAEVLPQDKVAKIRELQREGRKVGMVGDGVNDAPSLTQADVGIAIGAGTDVAVESAEIVLVRNDLADVVKTITLGRQVDSKMKQNLAWAAGYNVLAIPAAAGVFRPWGVVLRPEWGALLMSASSIIVVINALLLKKFKFSHSKGGEDT